ncbi:MAG: tRNA adenosine(34) deaminase TadA [Thermoleophilia bacterium]|nr:tRNA adenosine(34) deaminase TadA [Thermoleophilia bacterium]
MINHEHYMKIALAEARIAAENGEVPVGAVIERGGEVIAVAGNEREEKKDPTAHAEIIAIRLAAERLDAWRLSGCTIYVTIEPCPMCAGAIYQARIERLVYGATDEKAGAAGTLMDIVRDDRLNHQVEVEAGVMAPESAALLKTFFSSRR